MPFFTKRYHPAGTPPGTLSRPAPPSAAPMRIRLVDYDAESLTILDDVSASECRRFLDQDTITWVHVTGHPEEPVLRELAESFGLHSLALEDILNTGQRPKIEAFPDQLFVIATLPYLSGVEVATAQVSLFFGSPYIVSFCEQPDGDFRAVVDRLRNHSSRLRSHGVDFLLYSLLDFVVDQGFPVLENFGKQLDELETLILETPGPGVLPTIHTLKRESILLRSMLWPHREVISHLLREDIEWVGDESRIYLRDCYDHAIQIMDLLETYREMMSSMLDIYLSSVSNRMNEVMRVLTVIATVFIPLTFIVGVYGMNFDPRAGPWSMPELGHPWGYLMVWLIMIMITGLLLVYFRRKKWF